MTVARSSIRLRKAPLALCIAAIVTTGLVAAFDLGAANQTPRVTRAIATQAITVRDSHWVDGSGTLIARPTPSRPAAVLPVTSCADDGSAGTLRDVVTGAATGDTVDLTQLSCSAITLMSGQISIGVDDLTIAGPGAGALTIDGNAAGRIFKHDGTGTLTINALTVANGTLDYSGFSRGYGGCISSSGNVTLHDATVTGCSLTAGFEARGGGIYARGEVVVDHSEVSNNTIAVTGYYAYVASGGGIHSGGGPLTITASLIDGNRSEASYDGADFNGITQAGGGGASCYGGLVSITGSTISNNFAGCDTSRTMCSQAVGGGIRAVNGINISTSTFSGNISEGGFVNVQGGAFEEEEGPVDIANSAFTYNSAQSPAGPHGGAMVIATNASVNISGSTINNNSSYFGGGIWVAQGMMTLVNTTISGNSVGSLAGGAGGGVYVSGNGFAGPITLENSTVTANSCRGHTGGGGIVDNNVLGVSDFESSIVAGNTNADDGTPNDADLGVAGGSIVGANNLIIAASGVTLPSDTLNADPVLGPLQDNGGPTLTHALDPTSPAIDMGSNVVGLDFDQRGAGFPRISGNGADIGAFEFQQGFSTPNVSKSFMPDTITANDASVLTITLANTNDVAATLSADLVDNLPTPVVVANPANAATTCPSGIVIADAGTGAVTLDAGAQIPAAGTCTVTISVTADSEGDYTNTIPVGALQTDQGINPDPATAELMVNALPPTPPTVTKAFVSDMIGVGTPSTLTITLGNENTTGATLIAPLTDTLPSPIVVANPANATTTCPGGVLTADSGTGAVTLDASAAIPSTGTCTVSVSVTANVEGTYTNTIAAGSLQTDLGSNPEPATADLTVSAITPVVAKAFAPSTISTGAVSTLTITLTNGNALAATLTSALTDMLPSAVVVADPPNAGTTCPGGAVTANAGATIVSLSNGAEIPSTGSCTVTVPVTSSTEGTYTNTIPANALQTNFGSNVDPANAMLTVTQGIAPDRIFADGFDGTPP